MVAQKSAETRRSKRQEYELQHSWVHKIGVHQLTHITYFSETNAASIFRSKVSRVYDLRIQYIVTLHDVHEAVRFGQNSAVM